MNRDFLKDRIVKTKALIIATEDAVTALVSGTIQEYRLDTSQSHQVVKKIDVPMLMAQIDSLYNRCATLEARVNSTGVTHVRPAW